MSYSVRKRRTQGSYAVKGYALKRRKVKTGYVTTMESLLAVTNFAEVELPVGTRVVIHSERPLNAQKRKPAEAQKKFTTGYVAERITSRVSPARPQVEADAFVPSARAKAVLQGIRAAQALLASTGGAYDLEEVQLLLNGVSRQAIDKRVLEGTLLALPGPSNRRVFPTIQFTGGSSVLSGLKEVKAALSSAGPWSVLQFLASPHDDLGGVRPVDLLKDNRVSEVLAAAQRVDLQGA